MHPLTAYDVARSEHQERLTASARRRTREQRRARRRADAAGRPPDPSRPRRREWTLTS